MSTTPSLDERIAAAEAALVSAETFDQRRLAAAAVDAANGERLAAAFTARDADANARFAASMGGVTPATSSEAALDVRHLAD